MMVLMEEFREMMDTIIEAVPEKYFIDLNGGIVLKPEVKYHPKSRNKDLLVMGEYHRNRNMGRFIFLYYGSFVHLYSNCSKEKLLEQIRDTILHELTHHLESLAGEKDLEIEDAITLRKYEAKFSADSPDAQKEH